MRMTVKGYLALLVGVFVVALLVVTLAERSLVDDLASMVQEEQAGVVTGPPAHRGTTPAVPRTPSAGLGSSTPEEQNASK